MNLSTNYFKESIKASEQMILLRYKFDRQVNNYMLIDTFNDLCKQMFYKNYISKVFIM